MNKNCPNCRFELNSDQSVCPNCGADLENAVTQNKNDDINWSEYKEIPLGSVAEHFSEMQDDNPKAQNNGSQEIKEPTSSFEEIKDTREDTKEYVKQELANEQELYDNSILATYIKGYKKGKGFETNETIEKLIAQEKENAELSNSEKQEVESDTKNDESSPIRKEPAVKIKMVGPEYEKQTERSEPKQTTEEEIDEADSTTDKEAEDTHEQNSVVQTENNRKKNNSVKSKKRNYILTVAILLVITGGGFGYYSHQQQVEAAKQEELQIESKLIAIAQKLDDFYTNDEQQFIQSSKTSEDLSEVNNQLQDYSEEKGYAALAKKSKDIEEKLAVTNELNSYFSHPILVDDALQKDVHIKDGNDVEMTPLTTDDTFSNTINQAIQQGKDEHQAIDKADKQVKVLIASYHNGQLKDSVSRKDYEIAEKTVSELYDSEEKEQLLAELTPIEEALTTREEKEKAEKEQQEKAKEKTAKQQTESSEESDSNGDLQAAETNQDNQPVMSSRKSDIEDKNNDAWEWAPGVRDKVINECIKRGYIVEGGYTLEPARIENGEGYYNLYATNNQSKLLKGIGKSAFPMYIVTINAKTGVFRGNGNN
ncbi:cell division site-positioning protein MapZ family protein [Tetragenococcus koreensis]|uniref:cell division site-positioning protein MapZ family protein n=1 Tax=Tetragenococcus koreensis TaxID=290335 RepID=UPI001F204D58|nr:cell division site-positioning protein MapZ family protein [Tetragenococcus koreensis]MCF1584119.1 cell division site-positioning protein MapZ family protein [Tetragenococcus koreensis]MCF1613748.1 cell division site-positioning protein MapZ family protein [Tetragenococcus koreensis]MCF1618928.1 cell division site-positioning protein MapZ family protein [Tetragenococcus koreensis]MCF1623526.1 cell division site-positioning protein MapZ family protein [Tetragenococcus koreensis]MCF1628357.1 